MPELIHEKVDEGSNPHGNRLGVLEQREEAHVFGSPAGKHLDQASLDQVMLAKKRRQVGDAKTANDAVVKKREVIADELRTEFDRDRIVSPVERPLVQPIVDSGCQEVEAR